MSVNLDLTKVASATNGLLYGKYMLQEAWFKTIPFEVGKIGTYQFYRYDVDSSLKACCADGDTPTTITPLNTPVLCWEKSVSLCKAQLNAIDQSVLMSAGDTGMGKNRVTILDQIVNSFKESITDIAFNGSTTPAFEGFIDQATAQAITATDVYDAVVQAVMAMPSNSMGKVVVFISRKNYNTFQLNTIQRNLYHFNPGATNIAGEELTVMGLSNVSLIPVEATFPENMLLVTPLANMLHIGSAVDDEENVDFKNYRGNNYELTISCLLGCAYYLPEYAIAGTFTLGSASA